MKNGILCALLFIMLVSLSGCSNNGKDATNGFQINNWSSSLGGTPDESKYSYTLYISSDTENLHDVKEVYPIIGENIDDRLILNERPQMAIKDNYIEVQGEIIFDTKGLTKEQILELEPYIVTVNIVAEHKVDLNSRK